MQEQKLEQKCAECGEKFETSRGLNVHMTKRHTEDGEVKGEDVTAFILIPPEKRYVVKEINRFDNEFTDPRKGHSQKYTVKDDAIYADEPLAPWKDTKLKSYYIAGEKKPIRWERNPFRWGSKLIYIVKNEETTIEGIKAMVSEKGEGEMGSKMKWFIVAMVLVAGGGFMFFVLPSLLQAMGW